MTDVYARGRATVKTHQRVTMVNKPPFFNMFKIIICIQRHYAGAQQTLYVNVGNLMISNHGAVESPLRGRANRSSRAGNRIKSPTSADATVSAPMDAKMRCSRMSLNTTVPNPTTSTSVVMIIPVPAPVNARLIASKSLCPSSRSSWNRVRK